MDNEKIDDLINQVITERNDVWNRNIFNSDYEAHEEKIAYHRGHSEGMTKSIEILVKFLVKGKK